MNMELSKEAAIDFGKFMYSQHGYLEPWAKSNAEDYYVTKADLGGTPLDTIQGEFYRMTPEEYEKETGEKLPDGTQWTWDSSIDNWYTGDIGSWVGGNVFGLVSDEAEDKKKWYDYRNASGTWSDAPAVEAPSVSGSSAPWADVLHDDWKEAVDNRCTEVDNVRDELEFLTGKLNEAANQYMDTDLSSATDLDLSSKGFENSHKEVDDD